MIIMKKAFDVLFQKARGGEGQSINSRYVPENVLREYKIWYVFPFTYYLLKGLGGEADANKDKSINIS